MFDGIVAAQAELLDRVTAPAHVPKARAKRTATRRSA
jgi:hypothetical protein